MIEPGIGYRLEKERYSLVTNYSLLMRPETRLYIVTGDDRYERAAELLNRSAAVFCCRCNVSTRIGEAEEGVWGYPCYFVYSVKRTESLLCTE